MAKKSMINRELKRQQTVTKFAEKRAALKAVIVNPVQHVCATVVA